MRTEPTRDGVGELVLLSSLLVLYVGLRGTARALGAAHTVLASQMIKKGGTCARAAAGTRASAAIKTARLQVERRLGMVTSLSLQRGSMSATSQPMARQVIVTP